MKYTLKINGRTELEFTANNEQEFNEKIASIEKIIKLNRFCYRDTNLVYNEKGFVVYQIV